jgi:hypothetical protein
MEETVKKQGRLDDGLDQKKAAACVAVIRQGKQCLAERGISAETLRPSNQPQIELVLRRPQVREKLRVVAFWIVDQITRMHLEELRQQKPCCVGQMRARSAFDLGKIRLADRRLARLPSAGILLLDCPDQFLLSHRATQPAKVTLDLTKIADFVAELHIRITDRNNNIAICNIRQETKRDLGWNCSGGEYVLQAFDS